MSLQTVGRIGEELAQQYLISNGYTVQVSNYRSKLGEIDIVAHKKSTIYFCEVKTRIGDLHGKPYEAVTFRKLQHMKRAAQAYLLQNSIKNCKLSLQVISIELFQNQTIKQIKMYEII